VRISIASEDGREKDIALLQQGECFGEMALLDGSPRSATASAMEALETLTLFREDFLEFLDKHPEVAVDTTGLLTRRLRSVNQMLGDLAFLDVPTRVAKQLLEMAETSAGDAEWQGPIELTLGQEELARLVGASRETVSRVLNGYRRQGILLTSHRRITIKDRPALERMAYV
jgi:CRP-like cAMP-binding protein